MKRFYQTMMVVLLAVCGVNGQCILTDFILIDVRCGTDAEQDEVLVTVSFFTGGGFPPYRLASPDLSTIYATLSSSVLMGSITETVLLSSADVTQGEDLSMVLHQSGTSNCVSSPQIISVPVCPPCPQLAGEEISVCNDEPLGIVFNPTPGPADSFIITKIATVVPPDASRFSTVGQGFNSTVNTSDPAKLADESFRILNTNNVGVVTYEVTPWLDGCEGETVEYSVNVRPPGSVEECPPCAPVLEGEEVTICSGDPVGITFDPTPGPVDSFIIRKKATLVPPDATSFRTVGQDFSVTTRNTSDPAAIAEETFFVNGGTVNGIATYEVTPWLNGCRGETTEFVVNVMPVPVPMSPTEVSICSGDPSGITFDLVDGSTPADRFTITTRALQLTTNRVISPGGNATYQGLVATTDPNAIADDVTFTTSLDGSVGTDIPFITEIRVVPYFNDCPGDTAVYTLRVNPAPKLTVDTARICPGETTGLTFSPAPTFIAADRYFITVEQATGEATSLNVTTGDVADPNAIANDVWELADPGGADTIRYLVTPFAADCEGEATEYVVIVEDVTRPEVEAAETLTITLGPDGTATVDSADVVLSATDNCGEPVVTFGRSLIFTCEDIGERAVSVTATDAAGNTNDRAVPVATTVIVQFDEPQLGCFGEINVVLDDDCLDSLTFSQVLTGNRNCLDALEWEIVVQDSDPTNGPVIDGCGRFVFTITEVERDDALFTLDNFTDCWGYVNAEDKTGPRLVELPDAPEGFLCHEIETVSINEAVAIGRRCYEVDAGGGFLRYDSVVDSAKFVDETELGKRLLAGGGLPRFYDGCSDMTICVTDVVDENTCENSTITRSFTVTDGDCGSVNGEENTPTVATYVVGFYRPRITDLVLPENFPADAFFSCEDFGRDDPNPVPAETDYPFFVTGIGGEGRTYLTSSICNLTVTYSDGPRIETACEQTYTFLRTYTVVDWCVNPGEGIMPRTYVQLVKVGDFTPPELQAPAQDLNFDGLADPYPLRFTTNTLDCGAYFLVPSGDADDNCDPAPTVTAVVYPFGDETALPVGPFSAGSLAGPFPLTEGDEKHLLVYVAVDACGNESEPLRVPFVVEDKTAPVAKCEDALNVSIGGSGLAVIDARNINAGSYDECSGVDLSIACVDESNRNITPYGPDLVVTCNDLGPKLIGLRVADAAGNVNFCWLEVVIEDKASPICIPPAARTVNCVDLAGDFPEDINALFAADPEGATALLNAQFGSANGIDNCGVDSISQTVDDQRNNCGKGKIVRTFAVLDGEGFESTPNGCLQVITVNPVQDYVISFPADAEADQCVEPGYNGVTFDEIGCDLLTMNVKIDTFTATAGECYKLRVTYEIFNWCEYDSSYDPYVIPRNEDGYSTVGFFLHVLPRDEDDLSDDLAILDEDENRNNNGGSNGTLIDELDRQDGGLVNGSDINEGYGTDGSRGAFLYRQFIKVYDDVAPMLTTVQPDGPGLDNDGDCKGNIDLEFSISEDCSPSSVSVTASLNSFVEDTNGDGVISLAEFVADSDVSAQLIALGDGSYEINLTDLPLGRHAVRIRATDGCGNVAVKLIVFDIEDNKAPTPICINGLTATLMPGPPAPNGGATGMASIWAVDFVASPGEDCSGEVSYAIYRVTDAALPGFEPDANDVSLDLNCDDLGILAVRIYAIDPNGQSDYCETTLFVQAFQATVCDDAGGAGSLAGIITTVAAAAMDGIEVNITDNDAMSATTTTADGGQYAFADLETGMDYTVQPNYDPVVDLANVSTGDLILISRHILAISEFTGPYQLLAADVTQDGDINILDIIAIRRVILGLDEVYRQTPSWRFYTTEGAEVFNVNNLDGAVTGADFVAVEMGDVTGAVAR